MRYSVATLLRHCFEKLQHWSNIATLCCAKNHQWRQYESSCVTSPLNCEQSLFFFRFSEGSARLQSRAWSFACIAQFARWTKKKVRLLVVYITFRASCLLRVMWTIFCSEWGHHLIVSLRVSMTPRVMSAGVLYSWQGHPCWKGRRVETRQRVTPWSSSLGVGRRDNDPAP